MVLLSMCIVIARHCSSFPSHLTHISMEKGYTFVYKTNFTYKGFHNISPLIKICLRRHGGFKCVTALTFANKTISRIFWQIKNIPAYVYIYHLFFCYYSCLELKHNMRDG